MCRSYGTPDVITVEEVPAPILGPGQARVRVRAGAVNFPDTLVIANKYQVSAPLPFIPGSEFAGNVIEVADDVQGVGVGDRVFGSTFVGAFAEEVVVQASVLTAVPPGVEEKYAAAFGVAHRTAYHVLRSMAELKPGEELIVLGAGGGVGSAAVQVGAVLGATVTAVADTADKLEVAKSYGATRLVDTTSGDLRQSLKAALPEGADAVIDMVGGEVSEPALRTLRWNGRFVSVGYAAGPIPKIPLNLVLLKGCQIRGFQMRTFAENAPDELQRNERELMELLAAGRVRPHIGATFQLSDTAAALQYVAAGKAIGKVVIEVPAR
jgi:NADPH2:quinone reductase